MSEVGERRPLGLSATLGQLCVVAAIAMYVAGLPSNICLVAAAAGGLLAPTPLLVFLVPLLYRDPTTLIGQLTASDLMMLLVVFRALPSLLHLRRHRHARHSGLAMLLVAVLAGTSMVSGGSLSPLVRLALIAAFGFALGLSIQNMTALRAGLTVLLGYEVSMALVDTPSRLAGTVIQDPAQLGSAAALLFLLWRLPSRSQIGRLIGAVLGVIGVIWSFTRGVWFAFALSLAGIRVAPRAAVLSLVAVPIIAYLTFGLEDLVTDNFGLNRASASVRAASIAGGYQDFLASPLFGNGWSYERRFALPGVSTSGATYNVLVYVGAAAGLLGLLALILYVVVVALDLRRDAAAFALVVLFLAASMTEMPLYPQSFTGFLGLAVLPATVAWSNSNARRIERDDAETAGSRTPRPRFGRKRVLTADLDTDQREAGPTVH